MKLALALLIALVPTVVRAQDGLAAPVKKIAFAVVASSTTTGPISSGWQILDNELNYSMFFGTQQKAPPEGYDPAKELAVAITLGAQPSTGSSVQVTNVTLVAATSKKAKPFVEVTYSVTRAETGPALSAPYVVVKFPRQKGLPYNAVKFKDASAGAQGEKNAALTGKVKSSSAGVSITDDATKTCYSVEGPLAKALAALDGKTVSVRAAISGKRARVTRLAGTNEGTAPVSIVDAAGQEIDRIAPGRKVEIIGVSADGSSFVVLGLLQAGYASRATLAVTAVATPGLAGVVSH